MSARKPQPHDAMYAHSPRTHRPLAVLTVLLSVLAALSACDARAPENRSPADVPPPAISANTPSACVLAFLDALDRGDRETMNALTYYASRPDLDALAHIDVGYYRIDHVVLLRRVFTTGVLIDTRTGAVGPFDLALEPRAVVGANTLTEYQFVDVSALVTAVEEANVGERSRVGKRFDRSSLPWALEADP